MTPCPHGMPSPKACTDCMYEGNVEPPARPEPEVGDGPVYVAGLESQCWACNLPIAEGALIRRTNRDRWVHERCAP
jgi:hypothetical protein